ncbi:class I SAM-dependent methyltransferase [Burkholderia gladioli]|uniref:class I SAM-dependent methyltransferase n=1 Tax=Burkholderia gladioli TaxID=28095 RepID=UPI00163E7D8E|nr:class I SAM-dependent methyltransferase [Burkholderia gladioli]
MPLSARAPKLSTVPRFAAASIAAALIALGLGACARPPAANAGAVDTAAIVPPAVSLDAAIAGTQRSDAARARDRYRHPGATLRFFGLDADQTVLEIAPGGGWYTDILAPVLRGKGRLYEAEYIGPAPEPEAERRGDLAYARKLAAHPEIYGPVVIGSLRDGRFSGFDAQRHVDTVLTFRNIHNWIKDGQIDANLRAFYDALKPGGVLGVEEHRARPGTSLQRMIDSGYVTEAYVIEHARAAGFVLAGRSEINANPRDTTDHPHGVWSLPPTYAGGDTDRAQYAEIGESDRMTLKFVKP